MRGQDRLTLSANNSSPDHGQLAGRDVSAPDVAKGVARRRLRADFIAFRAGLAGTAA
jgi:hypothetical protein